MSRINPEVVSVRPEPEPEVLRAIEEAIRTAWPEPALETPEEVPVWRFSGRWWAQPAALRRDRPLSAS
ncbi:MAG: hypothetical protein WAM97_14990 [Acidimicrobiales bacterium]